MEKNQIQIVAKNPIENLHKEQVAFNKLSEKIEKLNTLNDKKREIAQTVLQQYSEKITVLNPIKATAFLDCAIELDVYVDTYPKLNKTQKNKLVGCINYLLNEYFILSESNEIGKILYAKYNDTSYEDEIAEQEMNEKKMLLDFLNATYGNHFTMQDFENTAEAEQKLHQKISELETKKEAQIESKEQAKPKKEKPKTKQQQNQEKKEAEKLAQQKEEEALQHKNIRSIYLDLVKVLHPDTEMDEEEKLWKQELMKEVTVAYNDNNILKLLDIEMKWLNKQGDYLATISIDKIKIFNNVLRKQITELEMDGFRIYMNPKYIEVDDCFGSTLASSLKRVDKKINVFNTEIVTLIHAAHIIKTKKLKTPKSLIDYLEYEILPVEEDEDDFFNMLFGD